jgi:hypothetical protein
MVFLRDFVELSRPMHKGLALNGFFAAKLKQIELTSRLVLAIIGLTSVSAILVPTYAVPSIRSVDIVDGEVKTADLANNAVTSGKIKNGEVKTEDIAGGAIQPKVHIVRSPGIEVGVGDAESVNVDCPSGEIVTGGGFVTGAGIIIEASYPLDENTWRVYADNVGGGVQGFSAYAVCMDATIP